MHRLWDKPLSDGIHGTRHTMYASEWKVRYVAAIELAGTIWVPDDQISTGGGTLSGTSGIRSVGDVTAVQQVDRPLPR